MTEKELAKNICRVHAKSIVDANGKATLGGIVLGEKYAERLLRAGRAVSVAEECGNALRHWVVCAGYKEDGSFTYVIANSIHNC